MKSWLTKQYQDATSRFDEVMDNLYPETKLQKIIFIKGILIYEIALFN